MKILVANKEIDLIPYDPVIITDEDTLQHLYHLSSLFMRFFEKLGSDFVNKALDTPTSNLSVYSDVLQVVTDLVSLKDVNQSITRYEVLFQYRSLLKFIEGLDLTEATSKKHLKQIVMENIATYFNQARTTQRFLFLNTVTTRNNIPASIKDIFLDPNCVLVEMVKHKLIDVSSEQKHYYISYSSKSILESLETTLLIKQGLDGYIDMPIKQYV